MKTVNVNDKVKVKCPVYYNGQTKYGTVKKLMQSKQGTQQAAILIDGKSRCTILATAWLTPIK